MPIAPSRAEIESGWRAAVDLLDQTLLYGRRNSKNVLGMLDTLYQAIESDWADDISEAGQAVRAALAGAVSPEIAQAIQRPFLRQYCKTIVGRGNLNDDQDMLDELYQYFYDNDFYVQSRQISFASPSAAAANVGNGQIIRLTKDKYNFDLEACHIEPHRAKCVLDFNTGTRLGEEVFDLVGSTPGRDMIERSASGLNSRIAALSTDNSILGNASFSTFGGTAAVPTSIGSWTIGTIGSHSFDSTNYFRKAPGDSTAYALNLKATETLSQKISTRGGKLDLNRPYMLAVVWNAAVGSANGTLQLSVGASSRTVTVTGATGWNVTLVPATPGQSCWYRLAAQNDIQATAIYTRTSGNLLLDDFLWVPGTEFDGHWYWILPASVTTYQPFRVDDQFTWTDSEIRPKIQYWIWWAWNRYLPHSPGSSVTFTEP